MSTNDDAAIAANLHELVLVCSEEDVETVSDALMEIDALDPMLLYLCSDASRFVTGAAFTVDDGQSL